MISFDFATASVSYLLTVPFVLLVFGLLLRRISRVL